MIDKIQLVAICDPMWQEVRGHVEFMKHFAGKRTIRNTFALETRQYVTLLNLD